MIHYDDQIFRQQILDISKFVFFKNYVDALHSFVEEGGWLRVVRSP